MEAFIESVMLFFGQLNAKMQKYSKYQSTIIKYSKIVSSTVAV